MWGSHFPQSPPLPVGARLHGEVSHNEGSGHRQAAVRRDQIRQYYSRRDQVCSAVFSSLPYQYSWIQRLLLSFNRFCLSQWSTLSLVLLSLSVDVGLTWITVSPSLIGLQTTRHQMTKTTEVKVQSKPLDPSQTLYIHLASICLKHSFGKFGFVLEM